MAGGPLDGTPYPLLRHLTLPVVAVTTSAGGRRNGMIANSAQRASLVPSIPRLSIYISKPNFTHDLVMESGVLGIHLLRRDQWDVIRRLGLSSGRDGEKLTDADVVSGPATGCPLLADALAAFECRVINAMDAGAATFLLADVVSYREGGAGEVMTSGWFREHAPDDIRGPYEARLAEAYRYLEPLAREVTPGQWQGPGRGP